jgi:glycosyltransferase involved in cell wall biosynthesis
LFVLLEAFCKVLAAHPYATLHLAGEFINVSEQEKFKARVEELRIGHVLYLYGSVANREKWELFGRMDVLCFLTHYPSETFGNCVLEGMIWELPVVATQWRGVQDLVVDNETGFLVPLKNPDAAAEKLNLLVSNPELRRRLGKNGRQRFLREFTLDQHLERMKSAIMSAAAAGRTK